MYGMYRENSGLVEWDNDHNHGRSIKETMIFYNQKSNYPFICLVDCSPLTKRSIISVVDRIPVNHAYDLISYTIIVGQTNEYNFNR